MLIVLKCPLHTIWCNCSLSNPPPLETSGIVFAIKKLYSTLKKSIKKPQKTFANVADFYQYILRERVTGNISIWRLGVNLVSRKMLKFNRKSTEQLVGVKFLSWVDSHT